MTYQELLDEAMPQLERKHLQRYIAGYEAGTLEQRRCAACAIGHMCREPGDSEHDGYLRYLAIFGGNTDTKWEMLALGVPLPALFLIEAVFEGWGPMMPGWTHAPTFGSTRSRLIYDACIEETARRNSAALPEAREASAQT